MLAVTARAAAARAHMSPGARVNFVDGDDGGARARARAP
jgi:hypothetical protein